MTAFALARRGLYGRRSECVDCANAARRRRYAADPDRRRRIAEQNAASVARGRNDPTRHDRLMWSSRLTAATYYAKQFGAPVNDLRMAQWFEVLDEWQHRCAYCGAAGPLWIDHMTPLSRGGSNTVANVVPACEECNRRKARRTVYQFLNDLCENGHERTDLYTFPNGKQVCRHCTRESLRRYRERKPRT